MARNRLQFDINAKDKTKRAFTTLKRGLAGVSKAVFNMKTGLAAVAGVAGIGLLIRSSLQSIDKLGKLSRQVFISTEDLSAFRLAADLGGTSLEAFAKGARTLAVGINDWLVKGTGIAKDAFEQLGITQDDLRATNNDLWAQFQLVADALNAMEDGTAKTDAAYKLFGGRNIELLTAIENGTLGMAEMRAEAERFGLVLDSKLVKSVEDANDSIARTKLVFTGLKDHITIALAPTIETVATTIRDKLLGSIEDTHGGIKNFSNFLVEGFLNAMETFIKMVVTSVPDIQNMGIAIQNLAIAAQNVDEFFTMFNDDGTLKWVYTYKEMIPLVSKDMEALEEKLRGISEEFNNLRKNTNKSKEDEKEALFDVNKVRNLILNAKKKEMEEEAQAEKEKFQKILMYNLQKAKKEKEIIAQTKQDIKDNLEGTLTILSGHSEKAFKILKAHKIAEAIVNTYSAVMKAFATVPYPLNYLAAGSALAFGMAQVQQIRSQKFTARRQGGIVSENKPYMVGEGGPETFIPNSAGTIVPGGVGGQNVNVNFTINAVDTTGFQQLLANERAMIVGMVNSAVNQQGKSNII